MGPRATGGSGPEAGTVRVSIGLLDLVGPLRVELGSSFAVEAGDSGRATLLVVEALGADQLRRLRAESSGAWILVVARGPQGTRDAAAYLDVGADAYLSNPRPNEVAAQLRALDRRAHPGAPGRAAW